jgi:RNA polymerase sigma-70 factor (ECF subfamily)
MLATFRRESAFSSWLYRIAVNVVLVDLRSERRRSARIETNGNIDQFASPRHRASPEDVMDLEEAIGELPPQARTIFVLHDIEGYQHDEIAGMMGLAVGTTKAQLHRARNLLKERLQR